MKNKAAIAFSILSVLLPVLSVAIYLNIESEFEEAIAAGFVVGCFGGSVTGAIALILNRAHKNVSVTLLSILPMIPTVIFLMLWLPYAMFG